ncbi:MAG: DEAD/DEAH box helicase [Bacteroidetes bacterium]|nr:DEAD/DEAH box helicase [Bacteroidota bacterium]
MTFKELKLEEKLLEGLDSIGFTQATPIQEQAIPIILEGNDLIAVAQTGTGKTAAYLLPILNSIVQKGHDHLNTLIIAPTRELAQQIDQQIEGLSYFTSVSSASVYGGGDGATWDKQKKALITGSDVIIATPGRLISFLQSSNFKFDKLKHLILDEADRMLDMGFHDDILQIIKYLPEDRQTLLFSATMPPKIRALASKILKNPKEVNIAISKPAEGILQQAYMAYDSQKEGLIKDILKDQDYKSVLIFASTKEKVKQLDSILRRQGYPCKAFHSDLEQAEREDILREFRNRRLRILVGTDVISRGIDVEGISLVVNYDSPSDPEDYIHRIGRTARAESLGTAITFINDRDQQKFQRIESLIGKVIPKLPLPEKLGKAPDYEPDKPSVKPFKKKTWKKKPGKSFNK